MKKVFYAVSMFITIACLCNSSFDNYLTNIIFWAAIILFAAHTIDRKKLQSFIDKCEKEDEKFD